MTISNNVSAEAVRITIPPRISQLGHGADMFTRVLKPDCAQWFVDRGLAVPMVYWEWEYTATSNRLFPCVDIPVSHAIEFTLFWT